jgi:hypothetical protein
MKHIGLLALLALFALVLAVWLSGNAWLSDPSAAVHAAIEDVSPAGTPEPARERPYRSYPAPTGQAGFRLYYQKRCYPGCHTYSTPEDALGAQAIATPEPARERPYRSYPAPTGQAGFRLYYQKRCSPGCHYSPTPAAPSMSEAEPARKRPYRSYPAPTGQAGFRLYYQKRCSPGCHYIATPVPTRIHP